MRFPILAVVCAIVGFGVVSGSPTVRAQDTASTQQLENQAFADLVRPESYKVEHAAHIFKTNKTPAAKVVARALALMQAPQNQISNENLNTLIGLLEFYGPQARIAIPHLLEITAQSANPDARRLAQNALIKIGPNDERVFTVLQKTLQTSQKPEDIVNAAQRLAKMGAIARRAIPDLNRQVRTLDKSGYFGYTAVGESQNIYYALGEIALKNVVLPSLKEAIQTLQKIEQVAPDQSILAFLSLQRAGRKANAAIPTLLGLIARDEEYSQGAAIDTLGFIGPGAESRVTQTLLEFLENGFVNSFGTDIQKFLSITAQSALSKANEKDSAGVPALAEALKSSRSIVRVTAAKALVKIGARSPQVVESLIAVLRADEELQDDSTRFEAWPEYMRLAKIVGKDQSGLLDAILEILDSPRVLNVNGHGDEKTRANLWIVVADILTQSGETIGITKRRVIAERVLQTLQSASQGERPATFLFVGAARAAGALCEMGKDSVPILVKKLQNDKWPFRVVSESDGLIHHGYVASTTAEIEAIRALERIGKPAAIALPLLQSIAESKEEDDLWTNSHPKLAEVAQEAIKLINAAS